MEENSCRSCDYHKTKISGFVIDVFFVICPNGRKPLLAVNFNRNIFKWIRDDQAKGRRKRCKSDKIDYSNNFKAKAEKLCVRSRHTDAYSRTEQINELFLSFFFSFSFLLFSISNKMFWLSNFFLQ